MAEKTKVDAKSEKMYCVKCRHSVMVVDPKSIVLRSQRPAYMGKCPHCSTYTFKIKVSEK